MTRSLLTVMVVTVEAPTLGSDTRIQPLLEAIGMATLEFLEIGWTVYVRLAGSNSTWVHTKEPAAS